MIILSPSQAQAFVKAKYTKRWKGKDGKWHYEYAQPAGTKKQKPLSDKETSRLMSGQHLAPLKDTQIQAMGQQLGDDILDIMDSDVFVGLTLKDYGVANTKKLFRAAYYAADKKSKETQGLGVKDRHGSGVNAIVRRATTVAERLASKGTKVPK